MEPTRRRILALAAAGSGSLAGCWTAPPADDDSGEDADDDNDGDGGGSSPVSATPSLSVPDQETEDRAVVVGSAVIDREGWVAAYPDADGDPDRDDVIGVRQLDPGAYESVTVLLDRVLAGTETVHAGLHYDAPSDGAFTYPREGDAPAVVGGVAVVDPFDLTLAADVTPGLTVADQRLEEGAVTFSEVALADPGWVAVHPGADGGPETAVTLGAEQLGAGLHYDVTVPLETPPEADGTLYGAVYDAEPGGDASPVGTDDGPATRPFSVSVEGAGDRATIEIEHGGFEPTRAHVQPGGTVVWVNRDAELHSVEGMEFHHRAEKWDFAVEFPERGSTASHTFEEVGIYEYQCPIHGEQDECGAVVVGDPEPPQDFNVPFEGVRLPCEEGGGYYF